MNNAVNNRVQIPQDGMSRYSQLAPFLGVTKTTFHKLAKEGKAPKPYRLGIRCTMWKNSDIHEWLANPVAYRAKDE